MARNQIIFVFRTFSGKSTNAVKKFDETANSRFYAQWWLVLVVGIFV
jgi:hypothetical protein